MIITTASSIDGYEIQEYLGLVCGTDIYLVGGLLGGGLVTQQDLFYRALATAERKLMNMATNKGANAVIGVTQGFSSPGSLNNMILAITGTAVKIKKNPNKENIENNTNKYDTKNITTTGNTENGYAKIKRVVISKSSDDKVFIAISGNIKSKLKIDGILVTISLRSKFGLNKWEKQMEFTKIETQNDLFMSDFLLNNDIPFDEVSSAKVSFDNIIVDGIIKFNL
jgi:uncharacterized protein YbjQ (UPF0145 family)